MINKKKPILSLREINRERQRAYDDYWKSIEKEPNRRKLYVKFCDDYLDKKQFVKVEQ